MFEENIMKRNKHFLGIILATFSLLITSCSNLLPNMSRNRRKSSDDEQSLNEQSSYEDDVSSKNYDKTSSQHRHTWSNWYVVKEATCYEGGLQQRECTVCGQTEQRSTQARGHSWDEYEIVYPATCTQDGLGRVYCVVCGESREEIIPAYGHQWGDWEYSVAPTCTQPGYGKHTCAVCGIVEEIEVEPLGHDLVALDYSEPQPGLSPTRLCKCSRCNYTYLGFNVNDVTAESKEHLVFEPETPNYGEEQGAKFWGRPIGNAMPLDDNGTSINQTNGECVYCSTERGDFFEYAFNLTEEQASLLSTCRLYCDAKPADWLNGIDFFAYGRSNDDWTPGFYIDGADNHIQKDDYGNSIMVKDHAHPTKNGEPGQELDIQVPLGKRIEAYRYALYVDDQIVDFDPDIENPTHGNSTNMQREEFVLPYTFHLHPGLNKISLHMAGGYRSTFYNFAFRPYVEPDPIIVNETAIEVAEGKTANITSSMQGLRYTSSDTSICTVDTNGVVTGVKTGTATITVSKEGNYKDAKVAVTVIEKEGVVILNLEDGVIAPEGGVTVYNSSSSGLWYRNFIKDSTVTYTFTSEKAGLFDIKLGLRGYNIVLADNFEIKVNDVAVALTGTVNTSYSAVDYIVGQANLKVGENVMVITVLQDNALYLKSLKFIPHTYVAFQTWSYEDLEANRTDSGWDASKDFGDAGRAFKYNKTGGSVTLSYNSSYAQKVMLQLKLAVKYSNRVKTCLWTQDDKEKTRITINGVVLTPNAEPDFAGSIQSTVNDIGPLSIPEWYDIIEIDLLAGVNTIQIELIQASYSYYLGGVALAK